MTFVIGEISRVYTTSESTKILATLQLFGMIFHGIAPLSPMLFTWVNTKIFGMEINQYNAVGLFLIAVTLVYQLLVYHMVCDLTLEPGYQIYLRRTNRADDVISNISNAANGNSRIDDVRVSVTASENITKAEGFKDDVSKSVKDFDEENAQEDISLIDKSRSTEYEASVIKEMTFVDVISNLDILMILLAVALVGFLFNQKELMLNIIAVRFFQWKIGHIGIIVTIALALSATVMRIVTNKLNKGQFDSFYLLVITLTTYSMNALFFSLQFVFYFQDINWQTVFILVTGTVTYAAGYVTRPLSSVLLFAIVPVHSRCYVVGVRQVAYNTAMLFGYFSSGLVVDIASLFYISISAACLMMALAFLAKRRSYFDRYFDSYSKEV